MRLASAKRTAFACDGCHVVGYAPTPDTLPKGWVHRRFRAAWDTVTEHYCPRCVKRGA